MQSLTRRIEEIESRRKPSQPPVIVFQGPGGYADKAGRIWSDAELQKAAENTLVVIVEYGTPD